MSKPLVSIIVASFQHAEYIGQTMDSILSQDYGIENMQIIVIDDGSTDGTDDVLNKYKCKYSFEYIKKERNKGISNSLNIGIKISNGKYILQCASDDYWYPSKVSKLVDFFESQPGEVGIVSSDVWHVDANGNIVERNRKNKVNPNDVKDQLYFFLKRLLNFNTITVIFRKEIFDYVGLYDESIFQEDLDMFYRILKKYRATYLDIKLTYYRLSQNSMSRSINTSRIQEAHIQVWRKFYPAESSKIKSVIENILIDDIFSIYQLKGNRKLIFAGIGLINYKRPLFLYFQLIKFYVLLKLPRKTIRLLFKPYTTLSRVLKKS